MMAEYHVDVTQTFFVELDQTKFTPEFMEEFRKSFYPFFDLEEHAAHIAQLQARGVIDITVTPEFIEGYGPSDEMGIRIVFIDQQDDVTWKKEEK